MLLITQTREKAKSTQKTTSRRNAPINVNKLAVRVGWGVGSEAWGGDFTFFKNLALNSLPTGKSFQSSVTKFPHPGLHLAVK